MKRIRILFCVNYMHMGGVERSLIALLRALPRDCFEPHVALERGMGELMDEIPQDVPVHVLHDIERNYDRLSRPLACGSIADRICYLAAKLRGTLVPYYSRVLRREERLTEHFDIAVAYQGPNELLDWYVGEHINADRRAGWIHFDVERCYINRRTVRRVYPRLDRVFIVAESSLDHFVRMFPEFGARCRVFHNIVDQAHVRNLSGDYDVSRRQGRAVLCTVGRVTSEKGQILAVEAAVRLHNRGVLFDWYFVGEGDMLARCRREVTRLGLTDCVHFEGALRNPYPLMRGADVYVQPSLHEGYCIAVAEARVFGMPIVCTRFSGSEQVAGLPNAQIVAHDADALADAVERAVGMPRIEREFVSECDFSLLTEMID